MTQDEVKTAIDNAVKKIEQYRDQLRRQGKDPGSDPDYREFDRALKAFVPGASGATCSRCRGSGREP